MDTNTTLLIMTNGRKKYLEETLNSLDKLHGNFTRKLIHDDSGDSDWLKKFNYEVATTNKVGFIGAITSAWGKLKEDSNNWVFHLEEDFLIEDDIYINNMIGVMSNNDYIKQMVLLRQPLGGRELQKGGIIASHPERYEDKTDGVNYWVEHRVGFSCNPCLYRKSLIYEHPWPNKPHSEREFGLTLFEDSNAKCAYWGKSTDAPKVMHIGEDRTGFNY
jgi:hypothetical protein